MGFKSVSDYRKTLNDEDRRFFDGSVEVLKDHKKVCNKPCGLAHNDKQLLNAINKNGGK